MTTDPVQLAVHGAVATLTWRNSARRNAIGIAVARRLTAELEALADREDIAVVHLDSESGPFCSGFDLTEVADLLVRDEAGRAEFFSAGRGLMATLGRSPQVLVATPREYALGFGCAVLARCDVVLTADDTTFGIPEIRAGVVPATVLPDLMAVMSSRTVLNWAIDGHRRTAAEARLAGLVTHVVTVDRFADEARRLFTDLVEHKELITATKAAVSTVGAAPIGERASVAVALALDHAAQRSVARVDR